MVMRINLTDAARRAEQSISRATIREVDDDHLMQEVKYADVYHSETPSQFERWQPVGLTTVPLKQDEDKNKKNQQSQKSKSSSKSTGEAEQSGEWNHDQPKGPAPEAVMVYVNAQRHHPVAAVIDDRRVRPYGMKPGRGAFYDPSGSEQMVYVKQDGMYVISLDGPDHESQQTKTRFASLRHVNKPMQTHKIQQQQQQQQQEYKHEGASVNTEVRCTKNRIEFRVGDTVVGYYDKDSETWHFQGKIFERSMTQKIDDTSPKISQVASTRFETVGPTYLGIDSKDEGAPIGEIGDQPYKQTYVKLA